MHKRNRDTSLGEGVYYNSEDYVGIMRRVVILIVDSAVLVAVYIVFATLIVSFADNLYVTFNVIYFIGVWAYLTVLKASRIRTVGYWLTGSRIINLRGKRPSLFRMTFRLCLWAFGPFNLLSDLMWSGVDEDRQTLRDRFAGTCVVKDHAKPIGTAEIHLTYYNAFGLTLMFSRVMRPKTNKSKTMSEPA